MLIVQGDQRTPGFACYCRIDRICTAQSMLGSEGEGMERTYCVQHSDGHMRQPTQRDGKRVCLHWRTACPADCPSDFDQHSIRHNDRQRLAPHYFQKLATDEMARLALVKGVHPHTGIDRVHRVTVASPALPPSRFRLLVYHWRRGSRQDGRTPPMPQQSLVG